MSSRYLDALAGLGCCVCAAPAQVHHIRSGSASELVRPGGGQRASDAFALPLCERHHTGEEGLHQIGVQTWERRYGRQVDHLAEVHDRLARAGVAPPEPRRRARREPPSKMLPRRA